MKTVVLLHGYNANEVNWDQVVWGTPPDNPGRIPTAVAVTLEEDAELLLLFGSSIGKEENGVWVSSGKLMADLLFARLEKLKEFTILHALQSFSPERIEKKVKTVFKLIEDFEHPANTKGELKVVAQIFQKENLGVEKLICVSSRDHVSRIIRDAHVVFEGDPLAAHLSERGSLSLYTKDDGKTPTERASMANVVVAEPRAPVVPYFQRMFSLGNNPEALAEIDKVLKKYGK